MIGFELGGFRLVEGLWCAHLPREGSADQGFPWLSQPHSPQSLPGESPGLWALASVLATTMTIAAGMDQAGRLGAQGMVSGRAEPGAPCRCAFLRQLFSCAFLACCLPVAAEALLGCCAAGFARVNLSLLGLMSKRIPKLAYGQSLVVQPCMMSRSRNRQLEQNLVYPYF